MKVKLTKLQSSNNNLRTPSVIGEAESLPKYGRPFLMVAPPLESGNLRVVETSPVMAVAFTEDIYTFCTRNSIYNLELL